MPATYRVDLTRSAAFSGSEVYGPIRLFAPWLDFVALPAVSAALFVAGTVLFASRERNR